MSLRRRLTLFTALAVALAVIVVSVIVYVLVRDRLTDQIDETLRERASAATVVVGGREFRPGEGPVPIGEPIGPGGPGEIGAEPPPGGPFGEGSRPAPPPGAPPPGTVDGAGARIDRADAPNAVELPPPPLGEFVPRGQLIDADGSVVRAIRGILPVDEKAKQVAAGERDAFLSNVDAEGSELRVFTIPAGEGTALQIARPLDEVNDTLSDLILILIAVSLGGVALAAGLGLLVARTSLAPAAAVSGAARDVAETKDLTRRIEVRGSDELGVMAASFNQMMEALEQSVGAQRRLVADASHELRTPLATLRTNIETLGGSKNLDEEERRRILADLEAETEELTRVVADVVELAREPSAGAGVEQEIRLDELTAAAVERARRRARGLRFEARLEPGLVRGDPDRIDRAIGNLLDNAVKWSPEGAESGPVEVTVEGGKVTVRDHGPGFTDGDLARAFERFYRSDEARGLPGSGLGLAIVRRIAEEHGGTATARNAPDGGAVVEIALPSTPLADS